MTTDLVADSDARLTRSSERPASSVALTGFAALAVAMGIGRFAFTPILPMMQADTGLSVAAGGWLASANYLGYLAGSVAALRMHPAPETAIRSGLLVIGIATLGMGFASGTALWIALRALAGIASAWVLIFVSAWCLERLASARRPVLASTVFAGVGTGIAAAGAVCLVLMWRQVASADAWIVLGTLSLLVTGVIWPVFGLHEAGRGAARERGERPPRWDGDAVRLILCYGAWGFGYIIPATFLPMLAREVVQDPAVFGWAWPIFGAAAALSTLFAPRADNRRVWAIAALVMAAGVAAPLFISGIAGVLCAALLVGATFMVITMAGMQEARHVHGAGAEALMAAMTSAFALGQILGPVLVSFLSGGSGGVSSGLVAACALLLMSAYALARPRPAPRGPDAP